MTQEHVDLFFRSPRSKPSFPNWFGVLYLLRRDIDLCMGIDPDGEEDVPPSHRALWPGAMAILAGVDLLAKFFAGSDHTEKVGWRFRQFLEHCFDVKKLENPEVIYQLRNSLLHSFGLYSRTEKKEYHFFLDSKDTGTLVSRRPPDRYVIQLPVLHREFEAAVESYRKVLGSDLERQDNFDKMFGRYGRIHIG